MPATLNATDIPADLARKMGVPRRDKAAGFSKEQVRSWAIRVLAEMSGLSQEQRRRVLEFAAKVNRL
jgi:hypothetical protein